MTTQQQLDSVLETWNLLKHPFYQAWSAGALPVEALKVYAEEYGAFIQILAEGWKTLEDPETAQEEEEHAELWEGFASALDTKAGSPKIDQTIALVNTAYELFQTRAGALGAMYAFEAQQPATAKSKLDGLKVHYSLPVEAEPYFEVHARNWHESQKILAAIETLNPLDRSQAGEACERMAQALWNALSGIHEKTCMN